MQSSTPEGSLLSVIHPWWPFGLKLLLRNTLTGMVPAQLSPAAGRDIQPAATCCEHLPLPPPPPSWRWGALITWMGLFLCDSDSSSRFKMQFGNNSSGKWHSTDILLCFMPPKNCSLTLQDHFILSKGNRSKQLTSRIGDPFLLIPDVFLETSQSPISENQNGRTREADSVSRGEDGY